MSETYNFFNDVLYNANDVNATFYNALKQLDGIVVNAFSDCNELLHTTTTAYQSTIKAGFAWKDGVRYENTSDALKTHSPVTSTYKRIDRIVVRLDAGAKTMLLTVLEGVETTGTPSAPSITSATDIFISELLINNSTGTPAYTITDRRSFLFVDSVKRVVTDSDLTVSDVYSDMEISIISAVTPRTIDISAGAKSLNVVSSTNKRALFPQCFVKNCGAATATLRIKSGTPSIGTDITLLTNEWVLLYWDVLEGGWFIISDNFSNDKVFVYTTPGSGNHIVPAGRKSLKVIVTGGGCGGGRGTAQQSGSAAGTCIGYVNNLTPGSLIAYTVGAGGASRGTDGAGNPGTQSVFNTTFISAGASPGVGSTASGGSINITGGDSYSTVTTASSAQVGGHGGASYWGGGGFPATNANAYGSGGGGSISTNSGAGANGIIVVTYGENK